MYKRVSYRSGVGAIDGDRGLASDGKAWGNPQIPSERRRAGIGGGRAAEDAEILRRAQRDLCGYRTRDQEQQHRAERSKTGTVFAIDGEAPSRAYGVPIGCVREFAVQHTPTVWI